MLKVLCIVYTYFTIEISKHVLVFWSTAGVISALNTAFRSQLIVHKGETSAYPVREHIRERQCVCISVHASNLQRYLTITLECLSKQLSVGIETDISNCFHNVIKQTRRQFWLMAASNHTACIRNSKQLMFWVEWSRP